MNPFETYYVYLHHDPWSKEIVYVGKGSGGRAWDVTRSRGQSPEHLAWMKELISKGCIPTDWTTVVHKNLDNTTAFKKEAEFLHENGPTRFNRNVGEKQHQAKITNQQAIDAFTLSKNGMKHKEIAELYGVSRSCISMILSRKQWKTITKEVTIG